MTEGLHIENLTVVRGGKTVLSNIDLKVPPGRITALVGPNGSGKSTLLNAILGIVRAQSGRVIQSGADLLTMTARERAKIAGFAEQSLSTELNISVRDTVALGRIPFEGTWQANPSAADRAIVDEALTALDVMSLADRALRELSGGEQQRVHLARLFAQQPRLLLLDEPFNHLDIRSQLIVMKQLKTAAAEGQTVLMALHDLNYAATHCDEVILLNGGNIARRGTAADVLTPALLGQVYGVDVTTFVHPGTGKPLLAFSLAE